MFKTTIVVPNFEDKTENPAMEKKRVWISHDGDGLNPAQARHLIEKLQKWLAFVGRLNERASSLDTTVASEANKPKRAEKKLGDASGILPPSQKKGYGTIER